MRAFHPNEGRIAIATNAGWNAMDAGSVAWRATQARTAKPCGPDAPVAGVKSAGGDSAGDGDNQARSHRGEHGISCHTIAQGMPMFWLLL